MGTKKIPFFDFSAVLDKLQAIADNVHPTASGTSITPTGMHIVTEDDVQGAISELDSAVDSVNASLTKKDLTLSNEHTTNFYSKLERTGNTVRLYIESLFSGTTETTIATLPASVIPNHRIIKDFIVVDNNISTFKGYANVEIDTSGNIKIKDLGSYTQAFTVIEFEWFV